MRILYITSPLYGFYECLFDGATEINGLPSFNRPLKNLIEEGNHIDFVLLLNSKSIPEFNIRASWLSPDNIKRCLFYETKPQLRIFNIIKNRRIVDNLLKKERYDFVYGHGSASEIFRVTAKKNDIPFGQRLYGTFMWDEICKHGIRRAKITHLIEYLSFKTRKSFLLVTNDGSRGDLVYKKINTKKTPYEFHYWINGVNVPDNIVAEELDDFKQTLVSKPFVFYVARFDEWKRQERAVSIIKKLKDRGKDIHLYLAGPPEKGNPRYFEYVMNLVKELGVEDRVTYMGHINSRTITMMCKLSIASLSLYDVCNFTNVFHEMLASGAVVVVKNDDVVDDFINNGDNGFLVENEDEVVSIIETLLFDDNLSTKIRERALATSKEKMLNWDQRIDKEIQLIMKHARK